MGDTTEELIARVRDALVGQRAVTDWPALRALDALAERVRRLERDLDAVIRVWDEFAEEPHGLEIVGETIDLVRSALDTEVRNG